MFYFVILSASSVLPLSSIVMQCIPERKNNEYGTYGITQEGLSSRKRIHCYLVGRRTQRRGNIRKLVSQGYHCAQCLLAKASRRRCTCCVGRKNPNPHR